MGRDGMGREEEEMKQIQLQFEIMFWLFFLLCLSFQREQTGNGRWKLTGYIVDLNNQRRSEEDGPDNGGGWR